MADRFYIIDEDTHVNYENDSDLSYFDDGDYVVALYVNNEFVGDCEVWKDAEMDGREYITLNYTIVYLDTITKR